MQKIAKSKSCAVAGSIVVHENDCYYNRLYFVFPDGSYEKYDKKHLYTMGNEADHFTPGSEKKIVVYKNWKINLAICYDLRFPVWLRNTKDNHYDILLIVAAWRSEKRHHWMSLTTARAIENQAYVIAANNCGLLPDSTPNSPDVVYTGDCRVIDPFGVPLKEARPGVEGVIHSVLDFNELDEWKQKFPVLGDQDSFQFC
ncbi:CN hydrolase domain-containing protein [Entamoeba marina]